MGLNKNKNPNSTRLHLALFNTARYKNDKNFELQNWLALLTRFTNNKALSQSLVSLIENHYSYFWSNDRHKAFKIN
jgi:hypothetical protein